MDYDHGSGEQSLILSKSERDIFTPAKKPGSSSSSSSSSSRSSFGEDFFQLQESKVPNKIIAAPSTPIELAKKDNVKEVLIGASPSSGYSYPSSSVSVRISSGAPPVSGESDSDSPRSEKMPNEGHCNSEESVRGSPESEKMPNEEHSNSRESDRGSSESEKIPKEDQSNSGECSRASRESDRIPNEAHSDSEESDPGSPGCVDTPLSMQSESVMQSPPIQTMLRSNDSNHYRIPSHVFARSKSDTPAEWSVASNESLFSIHVGNNSFSRDQIFLTGRSGELGKLDDYVFSSTPPSPIPVEHHEKKNSDLGENLDIEEAAAETMKEVLRVVATAEKNKPKVQTPERTRHSSSHRSDGSGVSIQSFAFPIKKRKKRCAWLFCNSCSCCRTWWPSCSCFKCRRACSHCAWPSCSSCSNCCGECSSHCRWPSCSCCKWPSCFSCSNCTPACCRPSFLGSSCCRPCKWPSCSCFKCSGSCCQCKWLSCFPCKRSRTFCNC